jgi:hypothetical protein
MTVETVEPVTTAVLVRPRNVAELLRIVALFADTRQQLSPLEAVQLVSDGKLVTAAATDRYALAEASFETEEHRPFAVLVSAKGLTAALKVTVSTRSTVLRVTPTEDGTLTLDNSEGSSYRVDAVFGEFPHTGSVWPTGEEASYVPYGAIGVSAAVLVKLAKVSKLGVLKFQLNPNGARRAILVTVAGEDNLRIAFMPKAAD